MNTQMNLRRISVNRLKLGDPAYEKIRRSLHEFGYADPVIWNEVTGNIVGGPQRYTFPPAPRRRGSARCSERRRGKKREIRSLRRADFWTRRARGVELPARRTARAGG